MCDVLKWDKNNFDILEYVTGIACLLETCMYQILNESIILTWVKRRKIGRITGHIVWSGHRYNGSSAKSSTTILQKLKKLVQHISQFFLTDY